MASEDVYEKVRFRDLSGALQTAVVFLWIMVGIYGFAFLIGLFSAIMVSTGAS